ncbi:Putative methyltransferase [Modestobacter italicus]|uniref:Methyltransferase n=1 Tax=Modestobacter italicus (strain DSM 44449 / CECT 9708 / BC 501) TaxID=2732864 RepID=I4ETN6_MODI5|nr:hypothetical protein [Modestobacter marinus]CCH86749.1 Putative methyltransferase [Modestobacter marinus]
MDESAAGDGPGGAAGAETPWEHEIRSRERWVAAEERDDRAQDADRRAADRDDVARGRDEAADALVTDARRREELAYQRIREITRQLNASDVEEARQHVHLQQAAEAVQEAIDSGADEPLLALLREVLRLLDVQFADVLAAGIQRSGLRVDLQHADQFLAGAADDRAAASADRAAAASDRAAAAGDRDSAQTSRRQAAVYRGAAEQPVTEG